MWKKSAIILLLLLWEITSSFDPESKVEQAFKRDIKIEKVVESIIEILEDTISEVQAGSIIQSSEFHKRLGRFYDENVEEFLDRNPAYRVKQKPQPQPSIANLTATNLTVSPRSSRKLGQDIVEIPVLTTGPKRERLKLAIDGDVKKEVLAQGRELAFNVETGGIQLLDSRGNIIDQVNLTRIPMQFGTRINYTSSWRPVDVPYYLREYPLDLRPTFPDYSLVYWYNRSRTGTPLDLMAVYRNNEDKLIGVTRARQLFTVDRTLLYNSQDSHLLVSRRSKRSTTNSHTLTMNIPLTDAQINDIDIAMTKLKDNGCDTINAANCKLGKNAESIVKCKFFDCTNDNKTAQAICISKKTSIDDLCYAVFISTILVSSKVGYIQPTIRHFTDNTPEFKHKISRSLLEDTRAQGELVSDKVEKCFNDTVGTISGGVCNTLISGDFNTVYSTFKVYFSNQTNAQTAFVFTKNTEFWNCENKEPIWKDAEVYLSVTGQSDSFIYDIGRVDTVGYLQHRDCVFVVCDICIKKIPVLLKGRCTAKWNVDEASHYIELCNRESYVIAYYVQPMHDGPKLSTEVVYNSRFVLGNAYKYLRRKFKPDELDVTFEKPMGSTKGSLLPGKCHRISVADSSTSWIYYYAKCGENIHFHHEEVTTSYKCKLLSAKSYWPWFYYNNCMNWVFLRFIYILILLVLLVWVFSIIKIGTYIQYIICYVSSPFSFLLFKLMPSSFRCKVCLYPWSPWHHCPEYCICGHYFSKSPVDSHICPLADAKRYKREESIIRDYDGLDTSQKVKAIGRVKRAQERILSLAKRMNHGFDYKLFSSRKNSYTCYVSSFMYVLIIYVILCLLLPTTLAGCLECTSNCYLQDKKFVDSCENPTQTCVCTLFYRCSSGKISQLVSASSVGEQSSEKVLKQINGCLNITSEDLGKFSLDFFFYAALKEEPCLTEKYPDPKAAHTYIFRVVRGLSTASKLLLVSGEHPRTCRDYREWLEMHSDYHDQLTQKSVSYIGSVPDISMSRDPKVRGFRSNLNIQDQMDDSMIVFNLTKHVKNSISTLQNSVEEQLKEDMSRKKSQLQTELLQIVNLLKYNGSIYGRDHLILFPDPPPFHQNVYTMEKGEGMAILDMTIPARSGSSVSFRPMFEGREVPLTITLAVPETSGVYEMLYQYTTCKTRSIEVVRHDKCVGQCNECFNILKSDVRKDQSDSKKWGDFSMAEPISHEDVNNWACEGNGCWTINTGCLCAYCRNLPDPENCYEIYKLKYKLSKALLCMGVNDDRQCEQFNIGDSIQRGGKLQVQLQGSDEWSTLIKTESVAIHRTTSEILMGPIASLGEITTDFGTPQYNQALNVTFKERDVVDSYVCHEQIDQEVIVNSCFKDTFNMVQELQQAPAYVMDSKKKLLYHMNGLVGTYRLVITLPMTKLNWIFSVVKISVQSATCSGCFKCLKGATCTSKIDSSITGLVNIFVEGGTIRISTINLIKGIRTYTYVVDYESKNPKSILHIVNPNSKSDYATKSISAVLSEGNSPRTTVRNVSSVDVDVTGENDNTWGYFRNGVYKYNPISYLSSWFKSSFFHWFMMTLIYIVTIILSLIALYFIVTKLYNLALYKATGQKKRN